MALDSDYEIEYQGRVKGVFALPAKAEGFLTLTLLAKLSFSRELQQARVVSYKDRSEGAQKPPKGSGMMTLAPRKIKGVIFDLDQTLIDSLQAFTEAFNRGIKRLGLDPVGEEMVASFLDNGWRMEKMLSEAFPSVFLEEETRKQCQDEMRKAYLELETEKVILKSGVKRTLRALKEKGAKIGIVTGRMSKGDGKWLELRRLDIHQYIDAMVTAAEAPAKPAPDGLILCAKALGLSTKECVYVGDSRLDIRAGKEAGLLTVGIKTGVAGKELLVTEGPDRIVGEVSELLNYLDELRANGETYYGSV
jgi:phosphoglycolate phosphatase